MGFAFYYLLRGQETIVELIVFIGTPRRAGAKNLSQAELAKQIGSYHSIIGKYERDEVKPTIDVVKRLADVLETTAGYLLGESEDRELLKDPSMLKRLNDITKFPEADKNCILYALDAMINNVKLKAI